jgi:hypothetical protein
MAKIKEKADWEQAFIDADNSLFTTVKLNCDGYNVDYVRGIYRNRLYFCFYIDGTYKGIYSDKENEIGKKFGRPMRSRLSQKNYELRKRFDGKKSADKFKKEYGAKIWAYHPHWSSVLQLIRHLKSTCKEISLIT